MSKNEEYERALLITEKGMKVGGDLGGSDILALLVEALCHTWSKEIGVVDIMNAGKKVIDALAEAEKEYKIDAVWKILGGIDMEEDEDENGDE